MSRPPILDLAAALGTRGPGRAGEIGRERLVLSADLVAGLRALAVREGVRLPGVVATAFAVLLHRYTGQEDLELLWTVPGRTRDEARDVVGPLETELPFRVMLARDPIFRDVVATVCAAIAALPDEDVPAVPIEPGPEGERGTWPPHVGRVALHWDDAGRPAMDVGGLRTEDAGLDPDRPDCDLVLVLSESTRLPGLSGVLAYRADRFDADTIRRMAGHLRTLLGGAVADPGKPVSCLPLLTAMEREEILVTWNATDAEYPAQSTLHGLFEAQARCAPEATAVLAGDGRVSYGELDHRANGLARRLRTLGVGPEVLVGLCVDRSVELVVGTLAVLKAGGAYVPLDPSYPEERLAFMLEDARVPVLLTQTWLADRLPAHRAKVVCLDVEHDQPCETAGQGGATPDNLAYVIYTSGSTGRPKGIALQHRGVVNNLVDLNRICAVGPADRVLSISSPSFDMCVYEVLGTLAAGAAMVLTEARDPAHWASLIRRHDVTVWNSAPALLEMLVETVRERPELHPRSLRVVILGGDWIPVTLPDRLRALVPEVRIIALGGATEASIHSIVYPVDRCDPAWRSIPYGRPMANQRAYILDARGEPVPVGVPGELCLGGVGLARGYLGRPELTAERFVPDPFDSVPGGRLFKTGDLARYRADGIIELLGRMDFQVKIRGQRVELGEIAATLEEHPKVRDAVVVARSDGLEPGRLVAYVVASASEAAGAGLRDPRAAVDYWQQVYDATYARRWDGDPTFNLAGWISSYTDAPFFEDEMREVVEYTVQRILGLRPRRVLEIGCGTGLLLYRIAPRCERYDATDVSPVAIAALERRLPEYGAALAHVTLRCRPATDFEGIEPETFDTVILNSVVQHFPDVDYLVQVLEGAVRVTKAGGWIFLGDLRSLPHLAAFHTSVELHRATASLPVTELGRRVNRRARREKELTVDPALFGALRRHLPRMSRVAVQLRRGRRPNELNRFHYDVMVSVGAARATPVDPAWLDWPTAQPSVEAVRDHLLGEVPECLGVRRVPNARVLEALETVRRLADANGSAGMLREDLAARPPIAVDPEAFWSLGDVVPYRVDIGWSATGGPGAFDVVLVRQDSEAARAGRFPAAPAGSDSVPWHRYANTPARGGAPVAAVADELRAFLRTRLPGYAVPSTVVFLEALPLSPNGKVDRRSLPPPDEGRPDLGSDVTPPRTPTEEVIADIWGEALELTALGVHDNFLDLGGHSLTAAGIVARVQDRLRVQIPLPALFEAPTIAGFSMAVEEVGREQGVDVRRVAETLRMVMDLPEAAAQAFLDAEPAPSVDEPA